MYSSFLDHICTFLHISLINYLKLQCKKKDNNAVVYTYPQHEPLEDLNLVGFFCLIGVLNKKRFKNFVNQNDKFDFFYKYDKFDFSKFDVSWLFSCTSFMLDKISSNMKVKDKIRKIISYNKSWKKQKQKYRSCKSHKILSFST